MTPSRSRRVPAQHAAFAVLATLTALVAVAAGAAGARQWDLTAGEYHTHLLATDSGFDLHLHDKATHGIVDTARGRFVATLLAGGKREDVPLKQKQAGILSGSRPLQGDWTLLVRLEVPGRKPTQLRYSSKMKPGSRNSTAGHSHDGHDHGNRKK